MNLTFWYRSPRVCGAGVKIVNKLWVTDAVISYGINLQQCRHWCVKSYQLITIIILNDWQLQCKFGESCTDWTWYKIFECSVANTFPMSVSGAARGVACYSLSPYLLDNRASFIVNPVKRGLQLPPQCWFAKEI